MKKRIMVMAMMVGCVAAAVPPVKKGPLIYGPGTAQKPPPAKTPARVPEKTPPTASPKMPAKAKSSEKMPAKPAAKTPSVPAPKPPAKKTVPAGKPKPPAPRPEPTVEKKMPATAPHAPYRGAIAVDATTGRVLFADNERVTGYPASCTKLMTLLLVLEDLREGRYKLSDQAVASAYAASMEPSKVDIRPGQSMKVEDLLYALMLKSANDGAVVLAEHSAAAHGVGGPAHPEVRAEDRVAAFVARMNRRAQELGMTDTRYASPNGLPPPRGTKRGFDISTARDLAKLGQRLAMMPEVFTYTSRASYTVTGGGGQPISFQNHNYFVPRNRDPQGLAISVPECDGFKTGYTAASGSSIVLTARRNGRRVVVVVLGSAGRHEREAAAGRILRDALDAVSIW